MSKTFLAIKVVIGVLTAAALCASLSACSTPPDQTDQYKSSGWVQDPSRGTETWCVWWTWDSNGRAISCDYSTTRVHNPEDDAKPPMIEQQLETK